MSKNIVCIKQSLPKSPRYECEYLDLVTALASFDYPIDLVFQGDGVFSLLATDNESTHSRRLQALPLFDVHTIWVDEDSLRTRQLELTNLCIPAKRLTHTMLETLLKNNKDRLYLL